MHSEEEKQSGKSGKYGFGAAWKQWFRDSWHTIRVNAGVEQLRRDTTFDIVEVKVR